METNLILANLFLAEANIKASAFYVISAYKTRISFQGNFDKEVGLSASKFGEGLLAEDTGWVEFNFTYHGTNINITLT